MATAKRSRSRAARKSALAAAFSGSSGIPVASATRSIALKRPTTPAASTSPAAPSVFCTAPRPDQRYVVIPEHRFGKGDEEAAVRNPAVAVDNAGDRAEIIRPVMGGAARTEQQGMTGGSIETLVERRHPCRQQLDLGMADCPVFVREVAHDFARQVLVADEVEKAAHLVRH